MNKTVRLFLDTVHFSGNANNGTNAGFGNSNSNNSPSNTNANIGSQLCYVTKFISGKTSPLGEKSRHSYISVSNPLLNALI